MACHMDEEEEEAAAAGGAGRYLSQELSSGDASTVPGGSSSDEWSGDDEDVGDSHDPHRAEQRRRDHRNFCLFLNSKWKRRLKVRPRILIWHFATGGRLDRNEIVDTAIGYLRGQFEEQIREMCAQLQTNLARIAAGLPPHVSDAAAANGNRSSTATGEETPPQLAFDLAAVTGVGKELPGQSAFGRSLLVRQLTRAFRTRCQEGLNTQTAIDDAVPPAIQTKSQLLEMFCNRSESESGEEPPEEEADEEEDAASSDYGFEGNDEAEWEAGQGSDAEQDLNLTWRHASDSDLGLSDDSGHHSY